MVRQGVVSESFRLATILALTGGFMDAYSYLMRGGVFANAETGNIVLMGISLAQGEWQRAFYYLIPIVAFALGIYATEKVRIHVGERTMLHWREAVLWVEVFLVFIAGFIPQEGNPAVNSMIAFICAMQIEAFKKIRGKAYSSTMCTGNLKSGTELLCSAEHKGNWKKRREGLHYYWIDLVFLGGAALGVLCCSLFAERAIWFCMASLLAASLFIMYHKRESDM